ncbi:MAG: hypothetical protein MRERC_7c025 [Mycoplasmataceae bacterium RC_NB112A]|nr:MAG: hypothetical protein MRERC_8c025 [Mycoplasmataceae bacterium RC_NB112A]KLL01871.1 MAG: hypothetical protein MRERC_7c025 [Mycoplasmataceae bacterium RC_NB112A]
MNFDYLFSQSAHNENYRKTVVEPTIAQIFGVNKLEQVINTTITGSGPGVPGRAGRTLKIESKEVIYSWVDGPGVERFRLIWFQVLDQKLASESFCRALQIKEKELKTNQKYPKIHSILPEKRIIKKICLLEILIAES